MTTTTNQKIILGLTGFTALVHLFLGITSFSNNDNTFFALFILNFLGYLVLVFSMIFLSNSVKSYTYLGILLAIYAFVTIMAYVGVYYDGSISDLIDPLGIVTKLAELALIIFVFLDLRQYEGDAVAEEE